MDDVEELAEQLKLRASRNCADGYAVPFDKKLDEEAATALTAAQARIRELEGSLKKAQDGATLAGLLDQAEDVWTDYGSGFRVHFSFPPSHTSDVILRINRRRAAPTLPQGERQ